MRLIFVISLIGGDDEIGLVWVRWVFVRVYCGAAIRKGVATD